jgi:PAS domain S-box-containing protein
MKTSVKTPEASSDVRKTRACGRLFYGLRFWLTLWFGHVGPHLLPGQPATAAAGLAPALERIAQIRSLGRSEAEQRLAVRVTGVITYYDGAYSLFIQDATGGNYVHPGERDGAVQVYDVRSGDEVQITGVVQPGGFSPLIAEPQFQVLGQGHWPTPRQVSIGSLATGQEDCQWVEVQGIVKSAIIRDGQLVLSVADGGNSVEARIRTADANTTTFVDTQVRVRGVCGVTFNAQHQLLGAHLLVPSLEHCQIEKAAPETASLPVQPIESLMRYTPGAASGHRVRLEGLVTLQVATNVVFLQDHSGGVRVELEEALRVRAGDRLEVIGFPQSGGYAPILRHAMARRLGNEAPPAATSLDVQALREGVADAKWVRVEARLLSHERGPLDQRMILQAGDVIFQATLPGRHLEDKLSQFQDGSRLSLAGVCQVQVNDFGEQSFGLLLRDAEEIQMLEKPSWWNSTRLGWTLGAVCVVFLVTAAWGLALTRANEQLEKAKAEFRDLYDNAPIGYQEMDTEGRITRVNRAELAMLGYPPEEMLGKPVTDFVLEPECKAGIQAALAGAQCKQAFERTFRRKDGSLLPILVDYQHVLTDGKITGLRATLQNISALKEARAALQGAHDDLERRVEQRTQELAQANTELRTQINERQQAERERQRTQAFLNSVVANLPIAVFIKEPKELRFVFWNKAGEQLLGYTNEELVGKNDYDFFPAEEAQAFIAKDRETLERGQLVDIPEEVIQRRDGTIRSLHTKKIPIRDEQGQPLYLLGISEDITERKQAEAELQKAHRQLVDTSHQAGMAEVATGVLHNVGNVLNSVNVSSTLVAERVRKSKAGNLAKVVKLLRENEANLGAFMTNDPKGRQLPGYLGQLAEHLSNEEELILKEVGLLQKNIDHIKDIVTMQQSYAKVSGLTETVRVTDLVDDALRMNASALARHEVQAIREFSEVPSIAVEKHKVLQILVNLIRNAKYACDQSGRPDSRLTIRVTNGDDKVRVAVLDNGIGIPPENITRIFNHGFTTRKDGHGFGLHSGALAARQMGGELKVHSDGIGQGATFTLELPLAPPEDKATLAKSYA